MQLAIAIYLNRQWGLAMDEQWHLTEHSKMVSSTPACLDRLAICWWLCEKLWYLQYISHGDTAVLHWVIDICHKNRRCAIHLRNHAITMTDSPIRLTASSNWKPDLIIKSLIWLIAWFQHINYNIFGDDVCPVSVFLFHLLMCIESKSS